MSNFLRLSTGKSMDITAIKLDRFVNSFNNSVIAIGRFYRRCNTESSTFDFRIQISKLSNRHILTYSVIILISHVQAYTTSS